ncbi:MAG TPA: tetratricopeptide repeat protein [Bryobacteraceae bacterium]|nr:tetratricopeptide repeat protein [Bryobacteraceae bacterium]
MESKPQLDDELVMNLVELALAQPEDQRQSFLESACSGNADLFAKAWHYVQWETRMRGFLMEPLYAAAEDETPFQPGELLDSRFRIAREVARGGMGIVYEAFDEKLDRRIALKCARSGFRKRLPPEVRHASEISHPNVCKIFEIHTASTSDGEVDFLTMEFLEGETLAARLGRGPLAEAEARTIAAQICEGLAEAHRNRVVHGDLKSNNVILAQDAGGGVRAVITDFGLARKPLAEDIGIGAMGPSQAGGTPDYMAPELWKGEQPSAASDVYALGVILFELASGRKPYGAEVSPEERFQKKPPHLHTKWDRVIARCLDPDPARRFSNAGEVTQALAPSSSRNWVLAAAAAAILVVATGVLTYQRAAGPKESWRLAMLPVESSAETKDLADRLSRDAQGQLVRLKGGNIARLSVIPFDASATHVLHARLTKKDDGKLVLRAVLNDTRTRVNGKEWTAEYAAGEMRYAPVALAGMVTSDLGLPPLTIAGTVNSAAAQDYWSGLWYMRRNSTIDNALPLLERAVAEDGDSPLTYAALAEAQQWKFFVTKDGAWLERAKESEREAQRRNPDLSQVHRVAGILGVRQGLYELAAAECLRAIALNPNDGEAHKMLGQAYEALNRLDEALAELRKAVEVDPGDYRNHQQLGTYYYNRTNYAEALQHFLKMVDVAPAEPATHFALGTEYFSLGRLSEAEHELRLAIALGETPPELHTLGVVLLEERNYPDAAASILRALSLGSEQLIWRMNLGTAYRLMNRKAEAEEAYRRALVLAEAEIARNPRDARTRSHLAFVCARLGDSRRAESEIAQALQTYDARVRFMAIATFEALGRREDSLKVMNDFSHAELSDVNRWPDMADLSQDSRFLQLLTSSQTK